MVKPGNNESKGGSPGLSQGNAFQLKIELDDATAQGIYTNLAMIAHTETEFTMDFIYIQPHQPKAKIRARIISAPNHAKRFLIALQENIKKYENSFGMIKASDDPDRRIGFSKT